MNDRKPKLVLLVIPPDPGRKHSHLVMVRRNWRSKWLRVMCMGEAKRCQRGECPHARGVAESFVRCKAVPRDG